MWLVIELFLHFEYKLIIYIKLKKMIIEEITKNKDFYVWLI